MRAIILAAGKGTRISNDIGAIPKSTLIVNGKPIIRNTAEMLLRDGIEIIVCTGFRHDLIEEALNGIDVKYYRNPFFSVTNNSASIWFARENFDEQDTLIMSADVIFPAEMLRAAADAEGDLVMAVDSGRVDDGDYFLSTDDRGKIFKYGPDLPLNERDCVNVGLCKVSSSVSRIFKNRIEEFINHEKYQLYFENVFFSFIGNSDVNLTTLDVKNFPWREIDFIEDYKKAIREFGTNPISHC